MRSTKWKFDPKENVCGIIALYCSEVLSSLVESVLGIRLAQNTCALGKVALRSSAVSSATHSLGAVASLIDIVCPLFPIGLSLD